ncbi:MAG: hypothetical protein R2865_03090 [Deinococcales bacterium]
MLQENNRQQINNSIWWICLSWTLERKASDLIITVGLPPMLRIDGQWRPTEFYKLNPEATRKLMYLLMDENASANLKKPESKISPLA